MYPTRLVLENFGPFESLSYDFVHEPIAIIGENRTQDDQLSNGSGKSFMEQGLFYGIYGTNLRGVLDKKLIHIGADCAFVQVQIYCPIRKKTLEINRTIPIKGSSKLEIALIDEECNWNLVNVATVNDGNKFVAEWIEISAEDAKSYYVISKGNYKSFFSSSNTEKLALISRFINFSNIDKTKSVIEEKISKINEEKRKLEDSKTSLLGKRSVYEEQLKQLLEKDVEQERKDQINAIQKEIIITEGRNNDLRLDIDSCKKKIIEIKASRKEKEKLKKDIENELNEIDLESFKAIYKDIEEDLVQQKRERDVHESKLKEMRAKLFSLQSSLSKIETLLAGVIVCPKCHHEFLLKNDKSVDELRKEKSIVERDVIKNKENKSSIESNLEEIYEIIEQYNILNKETYEEEKELIQKQKIIRQKIGLIEEQLIHLNLEETRRTKEIEVKNKEILDNQEYINTKKEQKYSLTNDPVLKVDTSGVEHSIKEIDKQVKTLDPKILDKSNEVFKVSQWTTRFKDFKMYLALEQLKNIQLRANDVLKSMGSDLRLVIEGFKKGANNKVKEEITPYVFREEIESFFYYSGGEQARVEIALILAIQQMINATKTYGGMNFLLVDEVLESCDPLGVENIISSMSFLKQPTIIITHVPKLNEEIKQVKIIKENGISRLEE
jgi:exonuclease SbcC